MGLTWKIKLSIEDRIALRTLLMQITGSYGEHKLAQTLCNELITADERKALNIRTEGSAILWDTHDEKGKNLPLEKQVAIGPEAREMISRNLMMLDEAKALEHLYLHIYEVFVMTPWADPTP